MNCLWKTMWRMSEIRSMIWSLMPLAAVDGLRAKTSASQVSARKVKTTRDAESATWAARLIWSGVALITGGYQWSSASAVTTNPPNLSVPAITDPIRMMTDRAKTMSTMTPIGRANALAADLIETLS